MVDVNPITALKDNYIWLLVNEYSQAVAVDPGESEPVEKALNDKGLTLAAILVTHHHPDHTGGLAALTARRSIPVYGPAGERSPVEGLTHAVGDGDRVSTLGLEFRVLGIPGHTLGHIAFFGAGMLFSGDTLFSAGCGRVFEGDAVQMSASLSKLAGLPAQTRVYCGHEYTVANLNFALAVEPDNAAAQDYLAAAEELRRTHQTTLPSTLEKELQVNPFLRCRETDVVAAAEDHAKRALAGDAEVFSVLREWKNGFRPSANRH